MGNKRVPTLSSVGWVEDPVSKATHLFDYLMTSEHSQSNDYVDGVTSFPYLVHMYGYQPDQMVTKTRSALIAYFGKYFSDVRVEVRHDASDNKPRYDLKVNIVVTQDNENHSLGYLLSIGDSRLLEAKKLTQ